MTERPTLLCISTYEKGQAFLREAATQGCDVVFLTVDKLRHAAWPQESITEFHTMPEPAVPERQDFDRVRQFADSIARRRHISRVIALDEFDLEVASVLREHFRLPGMGFSATRFFRDKLAMRSGARHAGIPVPAFTGVFNDADVAAFLAATEGPWLLKPRWSASAIGIKKLHHPDEVWPLLDQLGDLRTHHLLERFVPGEIYHVEGITTAGDLRFAAPHKYGQPPMQTMHDGGVFTTRALPRGSEETTHLLRIHAALLQALGMQDGVSHSEFIRSHADGNFYFLETAARVGGAFIAEVVEAATGLNPWIEWARMEAAAAHGREYQLPAVQGAYSGSVICLARQEQPDLSAFADPEVVYRLNKHHHAGLIVRSEDATRVETLVNNYADRFLQDFYARMEAPDKPTS